MVLAFLSADLPGRNHLSSMASQNHALHWTLVLLKHESLIYFLSQQWLLHPGHTGQEQDFHRSTLRMSSGSSWKASVGQEVPILHCGQPHICALRLTATNVNLECYY